MLRSLLIYLSKAEWARQIVTNWGFAWNAASRFVAGESLTDAINVVKNLNSKGINATLDHLGEHVTTPDEARQSTKAIMQILLEIDKSGVQSNVSIKLTQIGMALDENLCEQNLRQILQTARDVNNFIRIDMEDSPWVDSTLRLFREMRYRYEFMNTGVVIQAYLYRSEEDIKELVTEGACVRLCKGAYKEPRDIAYPKKADVDTNYDLLARMIIESSKDKDTPRLSKDGKIPPIPAIASHDPKRLVAAKEYVNKIGFPKDAIEFQMLYGIRRDLQAQTVKEGYPVRVYVPYGTEWYPYFVRRLAERPANLWFFVSNYFRK